jgi:hypothetical protein
MEIFIPLYRDDAMTIEGFREARHAARERGDLMFRSPAPCKYGHTAPRYVSTGACKECLHENGAGAVRREFFSLMQPYTFSTRLPREMSPHAVAMLATYLTICVTAYCESEGVQSCCDMAAAKWSQQENLPMDECPRV